MDRIPLQEIPNQSLEAVLDGNRYRITIKESGGIMAVTIERNEQEIVSGVRAVASEALIQHRYLENGNFVFLTDNDEIPYYTGFASSHRLLFVPQSELESFRNA